LWGSKFFAVGYESLLENVTCGNPHMSAKRRVEPLNLKPVLWMLWVANGVFLATLTVGKLIHNPAMVEFSFAGLAVGLVLAFSLLFFGWLFAPKPDQC
jgi:hypothetical protein